MKNHLVEILKSCKTEIAISKIIDCLPKSVLEEYIDEIVLSYNFINNMINIKYNGMNIEDKNQRQSRRLISVLSNNNYYREKIINLNSNNSINIENNDFSMVRKIKVNKKEDLFKILKMFRCIDFFLLNFKKFDFNYEEKLKINEYLGNVKISKLNNKEKLIFIEKTGLLYPVFYNLDLYEGFNQEEYNFFKSIFNDKNLDNVDNIGRLLAVIFLHRIDLDVDKINKIIYLDFFKEHSFLIKEIENFLLKMNANSTKRIYENKNLQKLIGLADKLIFEEQLKDF